MTAAASRTEAVPGPKDLDTLNLCAAHRNLPAVKLCEHALRRNEGVLSAGGALCVTTGKRTGRSPDDKFIVNTADCADNIWWGRSNRKMTPAVFSHLRQRIFSYLRDRELFVQDCLAGADPNYSLKIRVVTELAWHSWFARIMLITPSPLELSSFVPEYTIYHAPNLHCVPDEDGTNSEAFVAINFACRMILIGGTHYAGEIKKSVFSVLNYLLPAKDVLPMHCSANTNTKGETAIFFGLSGTGKTTLSTDSRRALIGDDEHGWSSSGVFNFEGGCYAKVFRLSQKSEPSIRSASLRFGAILENVMLDTPSAQPDFADSTVTENTRSSYPLAHIRNTADSGMAEHPKTIIMLTADAFGVLPPISMLSVEQAMYMFLSGYTARMAGTEQGIYAPEAVFSACYGAPFFPRHPAVYARLLAAKMRARNTECWLVNTGWTGGGYGTGSRIRISCTRSMVRAAVEGKFAGVPLAPDESFGLLVPEFAPNVPQKLLHPRGNWKDKNRYDEAARMLKNRFVHNFAQLGKSNDIGSLLSADIFSIK